MAVACSLVEGSFLETSIVKLCEALAAALPR